MNTLSPSAPARPIATPVPAPAAIRARTSATSSTVRALKWSLMSAAIFWTVVYKLSESGLKVPDFVYVNF